MSAVIAGLPTAAPEAWDSMCHATRSQRDIMARLGPTGRSTPEWERQQRLYDLARDRFWDAQASSFTSTGHYTWPGAQP